MKKPEKIRDHTAICKCLECCEFWQAFREAEWKWIFFWWWFPLAFAVFSILVVLGIAIFLNE